MRRRTVPPVFAGDIPIRFRDPRHKSGNDVAETPRRQARFVDITETAVTASIALIKGKPAARRGRKTTGPGPTGFGTAGLPAKGFPRRTTPTYSSEQA